MSKLYNDIMKGFKEIAELKNDKKTINEIDKLNKKQLTQPKKSNIKEEIEMSENNLDYDKIDEFFDSLEPEDEVYFVTMDENNNEGETFFDMDEAINYVEDSVNSDSKVYAFVNLSKDGMDRKSVLVYEKDNIIEDKEDEDDNYDESYKVVKENFNDTISIRDELDKLDREDYRDLLNMYNYIVLSDPEKEELANLILTRDIDKIEDYLFNKYKEQSPNIEGDIE